MLFNKEQILERLVYASFLVPRHNHDADGIHTPVDILEQHSVCRFQGYRQGHGAQDTFTLAWNHGSMAFLVHHKQSVNPI